ncbi:hypothetical protein [Opitutus terrae]|uniref:Uncharacterized protein n=1 Tax=Opitutus terrae (strain DSM 11246 / JCM 15787 / PB90-1) TaxID=452637 RepID=B1ZQL4_OPITP|nr:hypothetical protein [Opitutus terrae]ACB75623.1 hypothetical protein Oter_2341 [Opitutus terrae PB90-1]
MKKWMYLVSVGSLLAIFLFFYFAHVEEARILDKKRTEEAAAKAKVEADRKAEIEQKARDDAAKRAADRAAEEAKKEADRAAKQAAEDKKVKDATDAANAKADGYAKQAGELEVQLSALRTQKEKLNREEFELAKQVELARVAKRNAELEIQRMTDMIAKRAADSAIATPPPPPAKKS